MLITGLCISTSFAGLGLSSGDNGLDLFNSKIFDRDAPVNADASGVAASNEDVAQELSLADIFNLNVVTSSRKAESRDIAPNVMYVVTKEQIQQRGYKNLYELLQTIPGYVITIKNIGDYLAQVRGIACNDNEKITIMINGHSINNLQEPILLDGPINLDNVERVEVIVGPGSVLYGANTLGSIVNLITKEQDKNEITLTGGTYRHVNGTAMFAKKMENASVMGSFSALHRDGWDAWPGKLDYQLKGADKKMGSKPESYFGFVQAKFKEWTLQGLSINDNDAELDLVSAAGYKDARRYDYIDELSVENNKFWSETWGTNFGLEYDSKRMARVGTQTDPVKLAMGNEYDLQQKTYKGEGGLRFKTEQVYAQAGFQAQMDQNRHGYLLRHTPDIPVTAYDSLFYKDWNPRDSEVLRNDTIDTLAYTLSSVDQMIKDESTVSLGGYLSIDYSPLENLKFTAACRIDHFSWIKNKVYFNPRLAACYSPIEAWTTKVMYNRAAHTADFGGTQGMNQLWGLGNPNAEISQIWFKMQPLASKPEIMQAVEWQNIFYVPKTRLALNTYYTTLKDFITWFFPVSNTGDFKGYGAEIEAISKPIDQLNIWANAAVNKTEFTPVDSASVTTEGGRYIPVWGTTPEKEIIGVPKFTAAFGVDWEIIGHLFLNPSFRTMVAQPIFKNAEFQYNLAQAGSDKRKIAEINADKASYFGHVSNFFIDLGLSYTDLGLKGLDLGIAVKNLTNNQTEQSQSFNTGTNVWRGTTFDATLKYSF